MQSENDIRKEYAILERSGKNAQAFGELYELYFDRIFNFIYRQTDDEDLTADLCSQTFLNALKNAGKFEFRGVPVSAWFYRIASNEVNKHYRKIKKEKVFSIEEVLVKELIEISNDSWSDELIQKLLDYIQVVVALMVLPVEGYLRNRMLKSLDSSGKLYKFIVPHENQEIPKQTPVEETTDSNSNAV